MISQNDDAKIIILAGGSFQGKSIIALEIANRFRFSGVITTDAVRNVLKVLEPDKNYLSTSTYLLPESLLLKQMEVVSNIVKEMISIYQDRGEHVIIEGMHFSENFLKWASLQNFYRIVVNNRLSLRKRIVYKNITRSRFSLYDLQSSKRVFGNVGESNVDQSLYMRYQTKITQIHHSILTLCVKYGFEVVEFDNIENGIALAIKSVDRWISTYNKGA